MNKKGFLKILEAIIAIIIVLSFVVAITPVKKNDTVSLPPDLEQTTNSILKEMQENPIFRQCVLGGSVDYDFNNDGTPEHQIGVECVSEYIIFLTTPVVIHPWNYSVKICDLAPPNTCAYPNGATDMNDFNNRILPKDTNLYLKSITLTVPDVSGTDTVSTGNYKVLTIYAWLKE